MMENQVGGIMMSVPVLIVGVSLLGFALGMLLAFRAGRWVLKGYDIEPKEGLCHGPLKTPTEKVTRLQR